MRGVVVNLRIWSHRMTQDLILYILCLCDPVGLGPNCSKMDARTSI